MQRPYKAREACALLFLLWADHAAAEPLASARTATGTLTVSARVVGPLPQPRIHEEQARITIEGTLSPDGTIPVTIRVIEH